MASQSVQQPIYTVQFHVFSKILVLKKNIGKYSYRAFINSARYEYLMRYIGQTYYRCAANCKKKTHHRCKIFRKPTHNEQKLGYFGRKWSFFLPQVEVKFPKRHLSQVQTFLHFTNPAISMIRAAHRYPMGVPPPPWL